MRRTALSIFLLLLFSFLFSLPEGNNYLVVVRYLRLTHHFKVKMVKFIVRIFFTPFVISWRNLDQTWISLDWDVDYLSTKLSVYRNPGLVKVLIMTSWVERRAIASLAVQRKKLTSVLWPIFRIFRIYWILHTIIYRSLHTKHSSPIYYKKIKHWF